MHILYTGPGQSYEVKGLTPATTYYCRVQVWKAFCYVLTKQTNKYSQFEEKLKVNKIMSPTNAAYKVTGKNTSPSPSVPPDYT